MNTLHNAHHFKNSITTNRSTITYMIISYLRKQFLICDWKYIDSKIQPVILIQYAFVYP